MGAVVRLCRGFVSSVLTCVMVAAGISVISPPSAAQAAPVAPTGNERTVPSQPSAVPVRPAVERSAPVMPAPVWPIASDSTVRLSAIGAGKMSAPTSAVSVGRVAGSPASAVDLRVLDAAAVAPAGGTAVGVRLTRADGGATAAPVAISIDYAAFATAYGGDFAGRLRLVEAPACALTTPALAGCGQRTYLKATNDRAAGKITATVDAVADPAASTGTRTQLSPAPGAAAPDAAASGSVIMLAAGTSSTNGDYRATGLAPTGAWAVTPGSGAFTYSVPVAMPPPPYGSAPQLSFNYDSQSTDGMTSATNNQPDLVGLGWSLSRSYIERHYRACSDDGAADTVGDLCWDSPNATAGTDPANADYTIVLNGVASELVKDPTVANVFHLVDDPGWRVQHLTGGANGDNDGEYWVVTEPSGDRFYFGIGTRVSDGAATNSVATVPVFGNNTGEPCNGVSPCTQAYRWNLDRETDANEIDTSWMYIANANNYYSTMGNSPAERSYIYDTRLTEIDYGYSEKIAGAKFTDKVTMNYEGRCTDNMADPDPLHSGIAPVCPSLSGGPTHFPDVPADLVCAAGDAHLCATHSDAPVFFSVSMLWSITTWSLPASGAPVQVMIYQLRHHFHNPASGTVSNVLWLDDIQRQGSSGTGAAVTLPTIAVWGTDFNNLLSSTTAMNFLRITSIDTDLGAVITIGYGYPDGCHIASPPDPANNGQDCFKQEWTPQGGTQTWGWFNKLLVTSVQTDPGVGFGSGHDGDEVQTTTYTYPTGKAGWRFPADPTRTRADQSWTEWRGYPNVSITTGAGTNSHTTVDYLFQGLDGDRKVLAPSGPGDFKSVTITGTTGVSYTDGSYLAGRIFEEVNKDNTGADQRHVIHQFWEDDIAPYPGIPDGRIVRESKTITRTKLSTSTTSDTTWRSQTVLIGFDSTQQASDSFGLPVYVYDQGDAGTSADDVCTTYGYAFNTDLFSGSSVQRWMALADDVRTYHTNACPTTANQDGQTVTRYDGAATEAANKPVDGNVTGTDTSTSATAVTTTKDTYDGAGRVLTATDGNGHISATAYSPAVNWPTGGVTVTTPAPDPSGLTGSATGLAATTVSTPANGQATSMVDANGNTTTMQYDTAGRLTGVWKPAEPTSGPASQKFTYTIPTGTVNTVPTMVTGAPRVATATLQQASPAVYVTNYTYFDGLGRTREAQTADFANTGGRAVTTTRYDASGNNAGVSASFFNAGAAGSGMVNPTVASLPSYHRTDSDWAGRTTESMLVVAGVIQPQGDVHTAYPGADLTTVTDPDGNITDTHTEVFGQTTSVVQHTPHLSPTSITTAYTYTDTHNLASITDSAGNVTTYTYDWAGEKIKSVDPDTGTTTVTYDPNGNVATTTDNKGQLLSRVYDALDRLTALWKGAVGTGTQLTGATYDTATLGKGLAATSTSYNSGAAYISTVDGYDGNGNPAGNKITIPAAEGALAGGYDTTYTYNAADQAVTVTYPAVGTGASALAAETVTAGNTTQGRPSTLTSPLATYVSATSYLNYGPLSARTYGTGTLHTARSYTYQQSTGALTGISTVVTNGSANTTAQNDTYSYDNAGNLLEIAAATDSQQQCYAYDDLSRLTHAYTTTTATPTSCGGASPNHTGGPTPYDVNYGYDKLGDITSVLDNVTATTSAYAYSDTAHVHAATDVVRTGGATGHDFYGYNLNGDQNARTIAGVAATAIWTPQQQLASMTTGSTTTSFIYDAGGSRLMREAPGDSVLYLPGQELHLTGTVVTPTRYYASGGATVAMRVGGGTLTWLTADTQGSADVSVNASTGTAIQQRYLPFGARRSTQAPPTGSNRAFLGRNVDPTTGLLQDGARYYDMNLGRFLSPDPITTPGDPQNLNHYSYSIDNPTSFADPSGLTCIKIDSENGPCADQAGTPLGLTKLRSVAADDKRTSDFDAAYDAEAARARAFSLTPGGRLVNQANDETSNIANTQAQHDGEWAAYQAKWAKEDASAKPRPWYAKIWSATKSAGVSVGRWAYKNRALLAGIAVGVGCAAAGVATVGAAALACLGGAVAAGAASQDVGDAITDTPITVGGTLDGALGGFSGWSIVWTIKWVGNVGPSGAAVDSVTPIKDPIVPAASTDPSIDPIQRGIQESMNRRW